MEVKNQQNKENLEQRLKTLRKDFTKTKFNKTLRAQKVNLTDRQPTKHQKQFAFIRKQHQQQRTQRTHSSVNQKQNHEYSDQIKPIRSQINLHFRVPISNANSPRIKNSETARNNEQLTKLKEIKARCMQYYKQFTQQKQLQKNLIAEAFITIFDNIDNSFAQLQTFLEQKHNTIKKYLRQKQQMIILTRQQHQQCLKQHLEKIKYLSLEKIISENPSKNAQFQKQLSSYASKLNEFYTNVQNIEKYSFKQSIEESVIFLNNLVIEEIKSNIEQKLFNKNMDSCSFSFNVEKSIQKCFNMSLKTSIFQQSMQETMKDIEIQQHLKKNNLKKYNKLLL